MRLDSSGRPRARCRVASSSAPGSIGRAAVSKTIDTPLAAAIAAAWPVSPNPVTSVQALTTPGSSRAEHARGVAIETAHRRDRRLELPPRPPRWNFAAVAMMPVPSGLVSSSTSPARALAFVSTRAGSISPVTA